MHGPCHAARAGALRLSTRRFREVDGVGPSRIRKDAAPATRALPAGRVRIRCPLLHLPRRFQGLGAAAGHPAPPSSLALTPGAGRFFRIWLALRISRAAGCAPTSGTLSTKRRGCGERVGVGRRAHLRLAKIFCGRFERCAPRPPNPAASRSNSGLPASRPSAPNCRRCCAAVTSTTTRRASC